MAADNPATIGTYYGRTLKIKFGSIASTTPAEVLAAEAGKRHHVVGLNVGSSAATDVVHFLSASTVLASSGLAGVLQAEPMFGPNRAPIALYPPTGINEALNVARVAGTGTAHYSVIYFTE